MKILVIDAFTDEMLQRLAELGEVVDGRQCRPEEVSKLIADANVLAINSKVKVNAQLLDHAPDLKLVCRAGVGMDHIDTEELEKRGIRWVNTPGANAVSVAEHTVGMLLNLLHKIHVADAQVRQFQWNREENRGVELMRKTVGIVGYGNTGSRVANRLASFGCRVLAHDKYLTAFGSEQVFESNIQHIEKEADIISFHVPLTEETKNWVNADFIQRVEKPFYLLNLARGPIVNIEALTAGLGSGKILGAGLDVLPNEKINSLSAAERHQYAALFAFPNTVFTPHTGGWSYESQDRINDAIVEAIRRLTISI